MIDTDPQEEQLDEPGSIQGEEIRRDTKVWNGWRCSYSKNESDNERLARFHEHLKKQYDSLKAVQQKQEGRRHIGSQEVHKRASDRHKKPSKRKLRGTWRK
eukprot:12928860-Prorocentrum_lima.AAC.1